MRRRFSKGRDTTNKMRRSKFVSLFRKTYHGSGRASESPGVSPYEDKADIFSLREDEIQDALASQLRASRVEFDEMVSARKTLTKKDKTSKKGNDAFYSGLLAVRSLPLPSFMGFAPQPSFAPFPITSCSEAKFLALLGLPKAERKLMQGLNVSRSLLAGAGHGASHSDSQLSALATVRLAVDPPLEVGKLQGRTSNWLLRIFPHGLRFSGNNMTPLPGWLAGGQNVALNMSNNDLAVHLHFALFDNSGGYLLKPPEMRMDRSGGWQEEDGESERNRSLGSQSSADDCTPQSRANSVGSERKGSANSPGEGNGRTTVGSEQKGSARSTSERRGSARSTSERRGSARSTSERNLSLGTAASGSDFDLRSHSGPSGSDRAYADAYWPPPRNKLHRAMVRLLSLHHLPKRGEHRPRYDGSCSACHKYHGRELSGLTTPPTSHPASSPGLIISLHPIGGFCAISEKPIPPQSSPTELVVRSVKGSGLNAALGVTAHCIATEPDATFVRVSVVEGEHEVAYDVAVLGRLRCGYRIFMLRSLLGTRIELAYLFVHISVGTEANHFATPRQLRITTSNLREEKNRLNHKVTSLNSKVASLNTENVALKEELKHRDQPSRNSIPGGSGRFEHGVELVSCASEVELGT